MWTNKTFELPKTFKITFNNDLEVTKFMVDFAHYSQLAIGHIVKPENMFNFNSPSVEKFYIGEK